MVYVFAIFGLIMGFAIGLGVINVFLRHYSKKEIKEDKSLNWTYGLAVWIFAGLGLWAGLWLYNNNFF